MSTYVFDQGWQKERDRLAAIGALHDRDTTQRLADLGVTDGWLCLEVGFGGGSVALWLADRVGSTGRVVATDLDPRYLDGHGRANLEVRKHDIVADPLEDAAFDLACSRNVLEWIPDRQRALDRMVSAVRPGGWVVVEDHDNGGIMAQALAHYTDPPEYAPLYERIVRAIEAAVRDLMPSGGFSFGGRLPRVLADTGLVNIGAEVHASVVAGGTSDLTRLVVELAADRLPGTGLVTASDIQSFLALTADPSFFYAPTLLVTAWGQRPA